MGGWGVGHCSAIETQDCWERQLVPDALLPGEAERLHHGEE